jgi:initiation factor 1A
MVKNTTGGTGTKGLARKQQIKTNNNKLLLATDVLEKYGCVSKMYGNGMCEITLNDGSTLTGHIRGKFRSHQKRHNIVLPLSIVLIGLREWEKPYKNCDIMTIYDDNQIEQLKTIPNIDIDGILQRRTPSHSTKQDKSISEFDYATSDYIEEVEVLDSAKEELFNLTASAPVEIDDI